MSLPTKSCIHLQLSGDPFGTQPSECYHEHLTEALVSVELNVNDGDHYHFADRGFSIKKDFDDYIKHLSDGVGLTVSLAPADSFIFHDAVPPWGDPDLYVDLTVEDTYHEHVSTGDATVSYALVVQGTYHIHRLYRQDLIYEEILLEGEFELPSLDFEALFGFYSEYNLPYLDFDASVIIQPVIEADYILPQPFVEFSLTIGLGVESNFELPNLDFDASAQLYISASASFDLPYLDFSAEVGDQPIITADFTLPELEFSSSISVDNEIDVLLRNKVAGFNWKDYTDTDLTLNDTYHAHEVEGDLVFP